MRRPTRWLLVLAAVLMFATAGCAGTPAEAGNEPAVLVELIDGSTLKRISLSDRAAARLDIQTTAVAEERDASGTHLVVPYSTLVYDAQGKTWAYENVEGLTFVRVELVVDRIVGSRVVLSSGPPVGTSLVTVGAAELWGVETGVGGGH